MHKKFKRCRVMEFIIYVISLIAIARCNPSREETLDVEGREEICFGEIGCFDDGSPFNQPPEERVINFLPKSREDIGTQFRFSKSGNDKTTQQFITNFNFSSWEIDRSGFNPSLKTSFIIHGYFDGNAEWLVRLKNALIQKKSNVFIVDWSGGHGTLYEQVVANIRVVGAETGLFIEKLMDATHLDLKNIHIIGHSLGAHAAGLAAKWLQSKNKKAKIGRITGLDPAGPYFNGVSPEVRLDKNDAQFVDVIHTNWANTRFLGFGLYQPIGHIDFYPNGGVDQPGCLTALGAYATYLPGGAVTLVTELINKFIIKPIFGGEDIVDKVSCNHYRAYELFISSVKSNCKFRATECKSWQRYLEGKCGCDSHKCLVMGYHADDYKQYAKRRTKPTKFYLKTTDTYPYCLKNE